jgi:outer membrane protein TolC
MLAPVSGLAQSAATSFTQPAGGLVRPYRWRQQSPVNLNNSSRLESLIRAGRLYLSLQDAIALALENNLDIELQRYNLASVQADLLRANTGSNVGLNLDPVAGFNFNWGHVTSPQTSSFITGTNSLINTTTTANATLSKSFLSGTTATLGWNNTFARSNSSRSDFNPYNSSNLRLEVTQHLLRGFGFAVNSRGIRVARNNLKVSDLAFKQQVIATVSTVIGYYWDLVSYNEDVKVKRQALALAEKLRDDNQKQVDIGTLAPIEVVRAEAQIASSQQALTVSETRVLQEEAILKNALSRTGVANPVIAGARIVPTDQIQVPESEAVQPVQDLIAEALRERPEMGQNELQITNSKISMEGTRNSMRPTLDLVGSLQNSGLAGQLRPGGSVDPFFIGGYGTAMTQVLARNFPNYAFGFQFSVPLSNRAAQADMVQTQLSLRQQEIRQQQLVNQVRLDVTNALIAVQQARAGYLAAVKTRELQEETLSAEEKKYALGASTVFLVVQAQRDLAEARSLEVAARSGYTKARVSLDQATGRVLSANGVEIAEAASGRVSRAPSALPAADPR